MMGESDHCAETSSAHLKDSGLDSVEASSCDDNVSSSFHSVTINFHHQSWWKIDATLDENESEQKLIETTAQCMHAVVKVKDMYDPSGHAAYVSSVYVLTHVSLTTFSIVLFLIFSVVGEGWEANLKVFLSKPPAHCSWCYRCLWKSPTRSSPTASSLCSPSRKCLQSCLLSACAAAEHTSGPPLHTHNTQDILTHAHRQALGS